MGAPQRILCTNCEPSAMGYGMWSNSRGMCFMHGHIHITLTIAAGLRQCSGAGGGAVNHGALHRAARAVDFLPDLHCHTVSGHATHHYGTIGSRPLPCYDEHGVICMHAHRSSQTCTEQRTLSQLLHEVNGLQGPTARSHRPLLCNKHHGCYGRQVAHLQAGWS